MEPVVFIAIIGGLILMLLVMGTTLKPIRFLGQILIKVIIGAAFLFFLNILGNQVGIHVPINPATSIVAGLLGVPGVAALAAIGYLIV